MMNTARTFVSGTAIAQWYLVHDKMKKLLAFRDSESYAYHKPSPSTLTRSTLLMTSVAVMKTTSSDEDTISAMRDLICLFLYRGPKSLQNGCVRLAVERKLPVKLLILIREFRKQLRIVTDVSRTSLTPRQIKQIHAICDRYERAWHQEQTPSIEAAAAGAESEIRPALLQHLAEMDILHRVLRGVSVDLEMYLHRWPDLDRTGLKNAFAAAVESSRTSISNATASSDEHDSQKPPALPCSKDEFFQRLRGNRLLTEDEIAAAATRAGAATSSTAIGEQLVADKKLTPFQVRALLHGDNDPLTLGEYIVQDFIGRGGMGTVYRAVHRRMKRKVAIKVLRRDIAHADLLAKRFLREVEVAAKLCHPNIVTAYDASEQNGISYLVSEFVEGQNLSDLVREYGPLSLPLAVDIVQQAARALEYAHGEGVIHRDIKPSNLLIDDAGNVKLLDVGLARVNPPDVSENDYASELTTTGMIMGTVDYISPEQAQNTRLADERSDVYSLGCTLFFLITGRAPYAKGTGIERLLAHRERPIPSLCSLSTQIPESLDRMLSSLMAKKPIDRMASMKDLIQQLEDFKATGIPDVTLPLSATDEMVSDLSQPSAEATSTLTPRPTSKSSMAFLAWVLLPGIAAVAIAAFIMNAESGAPQDSRSVDLAPIPIATLTDLSEEDVQLYRAKWATALKLDENALMHGIEFVFIPPGEFGYGDDAVATRLEKGFYLSQTEITVGQFREFADAQQFQTVAQRNGEGGWGQDPESSDTKRWIQDPTFCWNNLGAQFVSQKHPATSLAYTDMIAFCEWMSREAERTIRLPTEQEWEYACRCGRRGRWSFGDDAEQLHEYAWFESNGNKDMHPTRSLKPNAWGLYDMHGNEFERCLVSDAEASGYSGSGPIRGGNIFSPADETTSSIRQLSPLNTPTQGAFRIVMELPQL